MSRVALLLGGLVVLLAPWLPYHGSLRNGFVYDDRIAIEENERLHSVERVSEIWRTEYWNRPELPSRLYRPLTLTAFAYEWKGSSGAPSAFHRTNVLAHGAVSALAYLCVGLLLMAAPRGGSSARANQNRAAWIAAFLVGLIWALHPMHSEVVLAVVGRAELLATGLGLLALLAARVVWMARSPALAMAAWGMATLAAAAACLAKESAFLLPFLAAILGAADLPARAALSGSRAGRRSWGEVLAGGLQAALPLAPGVLFAFALRAWVLRDTPAPILAFADNPLVGSPLIPRVATALAVFAKYVGLFVWPSLLTPDYSYGALEPIGFGSLGPWIGLALVVVGLVVWARGVRSADPLARVAASGAGWAVLTLLAVSNLFVLLGTLFAERLSYLPALGLALLLAAGLAALARAARSLWVLGGVGALLLVLSGLGVRVGQARTEAWRTNLSLFERATKDQPKSFRVWTGLGESLMNDGRPDEAIEPLQRALTIFDGFGATHSCLMSIYYDRGEWELARRHALRLREIVPVDAKSRFVLADLAQREGRLDEAKQLADEGMSLDADYLPLELVLGRVASGQRRDRDAVSHYARVVRENPQLIAARAEMGPSLVRLEQWSDAVENYRVVVEQQPDWSAQNYLAWSLLQLVRAQPGRMERDALLGEAELAARASVAAASPELQRYPLDTLAEVLIERGVTDAAASILSKLAAEYPNETKFRERRRALRSR